MSAMSPRYKYGEKITCWGYTFTHSPLHLSREDMQPLKYSYDTLAEECLAILDEISPPRAHSEAKRGPEKDDEQENEVEQEENGERMERKPRSATSRDLYALLEEHHAAHPKLTQLWTEINGVPAWVDWEQIGRGQEVFYRYGGPALTGLAYQSLLGGMGAARVVETLARTGGFSVKVAHRRLFETTQHILQCTRALASVQPGGEGFMSTVRVRFLHAAVRRRILGLQQRHPGYYDTAQLGVPVNDLDSLGTISTFSATLIWLSLPRQGIHLRAQEKEDYVALWRWIAHVIGAPTAPYLTSPARAKAVMESLLLHEIGPTETSRLLANNVIEALADQPPGFASAEMLVAGARWLNGDALCDALGLQRVRLRYKALMAGQCLFFMAFCYTNRAIARWDAARIAMVRRLFYNIIVASPYGLRGKETGFEFTHVPELETIAVQRSEDKALRARRQAGLHVNSRFVERRNAKWLAYGIGTLLVTGWCMYKAINVAWIWLRQA